MVLSGGTGDERDPAIRTILFTDIVGSTNERLGDDKGMALLGVHDAIVRDALAADNGREVKHTGDGIMASFVSAAAAIRCATRIQRALAEHQRKNSGYPLKVRIGAAAGEPVEREHDLFGATVQLAARLCSHAQPEQILVSNVVAELCLGKASFKDLGELSVKGFIARSAFMPSNGPAQSKKEARDRSRTRAERLVRIHVRQAIELAAQQRPFSD